MFSDTLIWTHDDQLLANNDTLPLASPKFPDNGTQMLSLILLDGSAHTLLHRTTIAEHILPFLGQASEAFYGNSVELVPEASDQYSSHVSIWGLPTQLGACGGDCLYWGEHENFDRGRDWMGIPRWHSHPQCSP